MNPAPARVRPLVRMILSLAPVAVASAQAPGVALVRHAPQLAGTVDGSVQQLLGESTTLPGGAVVTGDLLVPGTPSIRLNGHPNYRGTIDGTGAATPSHHQITLSGGAALRHVIRRTDARPLPTVAVPPPPAGRRVIRITIAGQRPDDFSTLRDLTLNGAAGAVAVPPGIYGDFVAEGGSGFILGVTGATSPASYAFQRLRVNGGGALMVVGPVIVTVAELAIDGGLGAPGRPGWLTLRISGGGLALGGNQVAHAFVEVPGGTLALRGSARLEGGVVGDRLAMTGNAVLRLVGEPGPNQPPQVELTAPEEGAGYLAPATVTLRAAASDPDGAIARVEFFQGMTKLGETATAPFELRWAGVPPGAYALSARAVDNGGAGTTSAARRILVAVGLPYHTGFEETEGYTLGGVAGQADWIAVGAASVVEGAAFRGGRSLAVGGADGEAEATHRFPAHDGAAVAFIDIWSKPAGVLAPPVRAFVHTEAARLALVGSGGVGELYALDGNGDGTGYWRATGLQVSLDAAGRPASWLRVTIREDYASRRWDCYAAGRLIAADLGFADQKARGLVRLTLAGGAGPPSGIDDLYAGFAHPLFADADQDGLDDAWETQNGLDPGWNDRAGDADGDGLSNLREFQLGLRANAADSEGDGLPDAWEVRFGLNPLVADADADRDGDGVSNLREYQLGRDPTKGAVPDAMGVLNLRLFSPSR